MPRLKSVYSSSRFIEMTNNTIIQHQQSTEREGHYIREVFSDQSPFCPQGYENGKKKKPKEGFEISRIKK